MEDRFHKVTKENLLQDSGHKRYGNQVQAKGAHLPSRNAIVISMYREHLLAIDHVQRLLYHQVPSEIEGKRT